MSPFGQPHPMPARPGAPGPDAPRVLLVEDDEELRLTTRLVLQKHGFAVEVAGDGIEALERVGDVRPDVAVLDIMMPRMDGITLARRLRARPGLENLPIVMLTARDLPHDQLAGFDAGADDYVVKPFDSDVLAARLRAVLRRGGAAESSSTQRIGDLVVDRAAMTVTRADEPVHLSATEFRLLEAFCDHVGHVLSRSQLLDRVWGDADWGDSHVVEVNVQRLRAKIGAQRIVTVRGTGYKLVRE